MPTPDERYCFVCGHLLNESLLPTEDRPRLNCPNCGFIHYINPKVVCGTLPIEGGGVWLLRRGIEPRLGYWTHPAGFQEIDETTEQGALRETHEELGCPAEITALLGIYSRPHAPVNVVYLARLLPGQAPRPTVEALEARLFLPAEIPWGELAFLSTQAALRDWARLSGEDGPDTG